MGTCIGFNPQCTYTADEFGSEGKGFAVGNTHEDFDGKEYTYIQASAIITGDGYVVQLDSAYTATMITTTNALPNYRIGIARVAFAANEFGWVQTRGPSDIRVAASCVKDVALNTTAVAGVLDDAATTVVEGLTITVTATGAANTAGIMIGYPAVAI